MSAAAQVSALERADPEPEPEPGSTSTSGPRAAHLPLIPGVDMTIAPATGSPAWHALRRDGVGGSDVAAIMGLSPYRSAYEVWLDKRGELTMQGDDRAQQSPALEWGTRLEGVVRQAYADKTGRQVWIPGVQFRSQAISHMTAQVDGLSRIVGQPELPWRGLEVKTARSGDDWGEAGTDQVPVPYLLQVMHYMIVLPIVSFDVAVLIGGSDFRVYTVERDEELQGLIIEAEADFWRRVRDNDPPRVITVEDARKRWGKMIARANVVATEVELDAVRMLHDARDHLDAMKAEEERCMTLIMSALGDQGDTLTTTEGKVLATWKRGAGTRRVDLDRMRAAHPQLVEDFTYLSDPSRRFLLKEYRP